jgi:hypothetical protein
MDHEDGEDFLSLVTLYADDEKYTIPRIPAARRPSENDIDEIRQRKQAANHLWRVNRFAEFMREHFTYASDYGYTLRLVLLQCTIRNSVPGTKKFDGVGFDVWRIFRRKAASRSSIPKSRIGAVLADFCKTEPLTRVVVEGDTMGILSYQRIAMECIEACGTNPAITSMHFNMDSASLVFKRALKKMLQSTRSIYFVTLTFMFLWNNDLEVLEKFLCAELPTLDFVIEHRCWPKMIKLRFCPNFD